ncbi:Ypt/Rab-GAP domain of gyp1p superfamily protein [Zea mays]|nr:Ypt/Rab-GAP domain of gyp1p superfamily protein [Zea mays]ONL96781.1 Ypt/Rab-GAP domain of gyp1p superfamily protein [Zea mays]
MEMVEHDNRRMLSAKVEKLETEAYELRKAFSDKQEQEQVMLQILLRMEQEQKVAEDARIAAERDAAEQKHAAHLLQEKYEAAMTALSQMEKRAVMAETMLEATKQYQVGQVKANQSFTSRLTSTFQASRSLRLSPADFLSHSLSNSSLQTVHL